MEERQGCEEKEANPRPTGPTRETYVSHAGSVFGLKLINHTGQRLRQAQIDADEVSTRPPTTHQTITPPIDSSSETNLVEMGEDAAQPMASSSSLLLPSPDEAIDPSLSSWTPDASSPLDFGLTNNIYLKQWLAFSMKSATIPSPLTPQPRLFTVFSAMYINGELQGIPCATSYSSRTPFPKPSIPLPLHPTELQLMVVHPRWIDRLPFPKMRDSLIRLRGVVDEEELLKDFFTMPSFRIDGCGEAWDPGAWKMESEWEGKWGWLMI
jgi:hypothetical protein